MTTLSITLLVIGIIILIASFFIPDMGDNQSKKDTEKQREQIRRLMEKELDGMKLRVNEATNETVEYGMDKCERSLEKITNDKIMAVSEYASTVIDEIDRNHKEVMFLYDMLTDKQTDVKNTVRHAEATVKEVTDATKTAVDVTKVANEAAIAASDAAVQAESSLENAQNYFEQNPVVAQPVMQSAPVIDITPAIEEPAPMGNSFSPFGVGNDYGNSVTESVFSNLTYDFSEETELTSFDSLRPQTQKPVEEVKIEEPVNEFAELENTVFKNTSNNNQQILKMSREGMSVVDIARELNLGVGEVQLVIDLFN